MGLDPITAQVVREYLDALAIEMSTIVERCAMHPLFNEVHDYSTGVFYYDHEQTHLIAMSLATAVPNHIIASSLSVDAAVATFGSELEDGDVVLLNDPYFGGTHNADWTLMTPVFLTTGDIIFPTVRAHMADSGGPVPSGYNPSAREVWQEAFRLTPLKLAARGEVRADVMRLLLRNTRIPTTLEGDVRAIMGACLVGRAKVRALIDKYGDEVVRDSMDAAMDYTERRFRAEIESWPDGTYRGEARLDHDSAGGRDLPIRCAVTVAGSEVTIDFAGSAAQSPGNVNSPYGNTASAAYAALCTAMPPDIPVNSGLFRAVHVQAPRGSVVNPIAPAPVMLATAHVNGEIGTAVMRALEQVVPDTCAAIANAGTLLSLAGVDERHDEYFVTVELGAFATNAGGAKGVDGWGGWPTPSSAIRFSTIEMLELQFPFTYHRFEYTTDTAAPGRWRGVPAFASELECMSDQQANVFVACVRNRPPGWVGGGEGAASWVRLDAGGEGEQLVEEAVTNARVPKGGRIATFKGGGGGWGDPWTRDPQLVLGDVLDDVYTVAFARDAFGVVISGTPPAVDLAATERLRSSRPSPVEGSAR